MDQKIEPCYTCRNRRIQCDQSGMPCAKCQKSGLECNEKRPVRWVQGVAIRGKMMGRTFSSNADNVNKKSALIKSRRSVVNPVRPGSLNFNNFTLDSLPNLSFTLQDPSVLHLDRISRYYVDYYNERICKLFIVYDSDKNPFRSLISLGLKDPALLKALLALAARHHVNAGQCFDQAETPTEPRLVNAHRDALSFKHQAIEALSLSLRDNKDLKQDTTVASIFLLIFLDLIESGSDGWNFHLEGAKKLIASTYLTPESHAGVNQGPGETVQEIREFITKQIHLIETLGSAFTRPRLLSQSSSLGLPELQHQEIIEKSFLGCPESLLTAIRCLSVQRDSISASTPLDSAAVGLDQSDTTSLLKLIQNFNCYAWASGLQRSRGSSPQDIANLCRLSQAYKIGCLIYGGRILDALTGAESLQDDQVLELLGVVDSLKDDPALFKCILWPIFVAGLECQLQNQRDFLMNCLERFWTLTSCLNAVNAAKTLQDHWRQSSPTARSQWIFNIGNLGRDWLWI
ncbi:hypothetical protein N7520_010012 [Penicillium odoratum]|uniref:uncharacterized protein n=1 Tax=Penicillium odoratum TaxID=1167516 RepID=UPI002548E469|nr:uncharacterized protein N7520_010012 [Penicillium odoratum]KAJ5753095.1 hypothetical protein N7520_010012 [Penicillium odoratum]